MTLLLLFDVLSRFLPFSGQSGFLGSSAIAHNLTGCARYNMNMELIGVISKTELAERQQIHRKNIKEHLQLLSSAEEQLEYQCNVPHVNVAVELACMWFDDYYHPEDKIFRSGFSESELQVMSDFSADFDNVLAHFPSEHMPETVDLVERLEWARLTQAAQKALQVFVGNTR